MTYAGLWQKIQDLDLGPIAYKLLNPDDPKDALTEEEVRLGVDQYRKFLFLTETHSEAAVVPTPLVDKVWHAHILDTRKYMEDCDHLFGQYLHHFPYLGLRGDDDKQKLSDSFEETKRLFAETFGDHTYGRSVECTNCGASSCGSGTCSDCGAGCGDGSGVAKMSHLQANVRPSYDLHQ